MVMDTTTPAKESEFTSSIRPPTSSIASSRNPCQSATFSIVVKPPFLPVQGFVRLRSGSLTLGTLELSNGRASWVTTALPAGQNTVTATYVPPNGNYLASSASLTQRVQEDGIGSIAVLAAAGCIIFAIAVSFDRMFGRCSLCYITDRTQFPGDERARRDALVCKIVEAAQANVDYIQLREKDLISCELESLARIAAGLISQLRTENPQLRTKLLINSRTDIALAVGADGVHLRSVDIAVADVRRIVGRFTIRGPLSTTNFLSSVACHTPADVVRAASDGADLAVFAPVFEKKDRPQTQPTGVEILRKACASPIPVLALGGITLENAAACLAAGAAGIAAIRLFQENRVEDIVRALRET